MSNHVPGSSISSITPDIDVAIVGGGVSGIYSGWRLLTADNKRKVTVFEGSDRIGGRLLSARPPGFPGSRLLQELDER